MKALCGLLLLVAAGVLALTSFSQTTHEGRPLYDATIPVCPRVAALASLPIGEHGHMVERVSKPKPKLKLRRRSGRARRGR